MTSKTIFLSLMLISSFFITGCQSEVTPSNKDVAISADDKKIQSEIRSVKEIKINEAPDDSASPSEAALHQFEVRFEDGKSEFPSRDSIVTESVLGDQGVLTIRSPEGKNRYAVFLYNKKEKWAMEGLLRLGSVKKGFTDTKGLYLPLEDFNADRIQVNENNQEKTVWTFVDEKKIITIARFEQFPFNEVPGSRKIGMKNGNEAYLSKDDKGNSFLYYLDTDKIVLVSGNVEEEQIIDIADSMPSVTAPHFPAARQ